MLWTLRPAPPSASAVLRVAGLPAAEGSVPEGRLTELAREASFRAARLASPLAAAEWLDRLTPGLAPFSRLVSGGGAAAVAVTVGPAVEEETRRLGREGRVAEALLLDAAGTALLGAASREALRKLVGGAPDGAWLAPGCHGLPPSLAGELARLAGGTAAGVEVLPSGMLRPVHSVAGLVVAGEAGTLEGCARCASGVCPWSGLRKEDGPCG